MIKTVRKIGAILTISLLLFSQTISVSAFEAPTPPAEPTAPTVVTEIAPPPPLPPEAPAAPTVEEVTVETTEDIQNIQQDPPPQGNQIEQLDSNQTGPSTDGNVGDTTIQTGDGLTAGTVEPTGNETIVENNTATVSSNVDLNTTTGDSSASQNVGNSTIITGDANTSGTVVTAANTNLAGLAVSEFNIVDDIGEDYILDFASGCILGCGIFDPVSATNNETFQNNEATLENNLTFTANSGDNQTDQNTGGDSTIQTGDANVSASVINFLNSNIAGNIILGVVNIFGDLIGDIILPEETLNAPLASANNTVLVDNTIDNNTIQTNDALIQNNLDFIANTGGNETNKNTGGNSSIETGEADIESQTLNIANSNIDGGNWWLVLVNEAGQWIGKILGSEDQSNIAGSQGTQFSVNPDGDITVTNSATQTNTTSTIQNNVAQIINNLNLFANTGENSASQNTGGDSTIKTGNANIVANLVNFVNNNIAGDGRLTITIVNVFGSWIGDFVTPGSKKENKTAEIPQSQDTINPASTTDSSHQGNPPVTTSNTSSGNSSATTLLLLPSPTPIPLFQGVFQGPAQVAGFKIAANNPPTNTQNNQSSNTKKHININLAWLLTLVPFAGISFLIKRRLK